MTTDTSFFGILAFYINLIWSFFGSVSFFHVGDLSFRDVFVGLLLVYMVIAFAVRIFGGDPK